MKPDELALLCETVAALNPAAAYWLFTPTAAHSTKDR